jgi:predicted patatin/cPLA2 family phospholipase
MLGAVFMAVMLAAFLAGCASVPERNPLSAAASETVVIPGMRWARMWGDELPSDWDQQLAERKASFEAQQAEVPQRPPTLLAISGGGPNGAFGAGLLNGWTAAGDRPEFTVVTGISTGALIAPFAYLGSAYDAQLRAIYTSVSTKDILKKRTKLQLITGDAAASTEPLKALIAKYIDEAMLQAIAEEFRKGRGLLIGTTNLDAARPVIWNIGRIATSGDPKALALVRQVLLASASIPGAFPPVYIEVEANGQRYDEMHVDGGASAQVFLYPASLDWREVSDQLGLQGEGRIYVIRNAELEPEWNAVKPRFAPIVGRTISSLIRTQGTGDLYRIYLGARRDGLDYNLASIPADFDMEPKEPFDPAYMQALFDLGYRLAKEGYPWEKAPPGFEPP